MRREAEESCIAGLCFEIWICSHVMPERVQGVGDGVLATCVTCDGRFRGVARRIIVVRDDIYVWCGAIYC